MIPAWFLVLPVDLITDAANKNGVDWALLASIVATESGGNHLTARFEPNYKWTYNINQYANSLNITALTEESLQKHSWGLCQIMGGLARSDLGFSGHLTDLLDKKKNLDLGAKYLAKLSLKYHEERDVVAAYNAGSARLDKSGVNYINQQYVDKVYARLNNLRQIVK